ncbi:ATP-binding cassette domain-containing protein [bacterium]|nr:ATP-binding cassette domain-containing protein [bacterium]
MIEGQPLLKVSDFSVCSPVGAFLSKLDFSLHAGEVVLLKGANGSGKSTFLRYLFQLLNSVGGQQGVSNIETSKLKEFSYLPQTLNREFFIPMTLAEVAELNACTLLEEDLKLSKLLPSNLRSKLWNVSSGGEKQRSLLVQSLLPACQLYVLDEPFNHLDEEAVELLVEVILHRVRSKGASFLIATHTLPKGFQDKDVSVKSLFMGGAA